MNCITDMPINDTVMQNETHKFAICPYHRNTITLNYMLDLNLRIHVF